MKIEVGDNMYLFLCSGKEDEYAEQLVISAHGGIRKTRSPTFTIPYGVLQFYSDHGVVTDDFGLQNFAIGGKNGQKRDTLQFGDTCYNYDLSKYQGRHNKANETYESILKNQRYVHELRMNQQYAISNVEGYRIPPGTAATNFDVLTIRNRFFHKSMNLKRALDEVGRIHQYQNIQCYFCRSFYFY